jgi:hypothetical protein
MNLDTSTIPAAIGAAFGGGFYAGRITVGADTFALIVSPKAAGEIKGKWHESRAAVPGAESRNDGLANTQAIAAAGSALAIQALALDIGGLTDWYIPSRDELELVYRHFKPTGWENYADGLDGVNPSSMPAGTAYTDDEPGQTAIDGFKEDEAEAMEERWYWSSTQHADSDYAWGQDFNGGFQDGNIKSYEGRARVVRRLPI